ncbi:RCC1 domain-containing protein 1-like isoform X6 [Dermacentor andersoni]|uniref:RCC1 domain-containing protein 1-like isoform X6 n=1 Tax=Dermacentor andersoni TaxID=34620 RepID=UPI002155AE95
MLYRYFGFDKFECFTCVPAKPFRLCPEDIGPVLSVHVGWANALFVTEAGVAELRGLGGPKQIGEGAIKAVLGIRGHWLVLCEKEALLGRGRGPLLALGPLQAAALGPTRALLLHLNGSMQELQLDDCRLSPVPVAGRVCHVSCGHDHQLALTVNGQLLSWGHGGRGQLGHGSLDSEHSPRLLEPLAGVALVGATAGGWHSAALSEAGDLYLWGWNRDGQLATDPRQTPLSTLPFLLDTLLEVRAVSLGSRHTAALAGNGSAWAWGSNIYGQLGPSADGMTQSAKPVEVAAEDAVAVDCSPWATLVLSRTSIKL